jgi:hypothetical protein
VDVLRGAGRRVPPHLDGEGGGTLPRAPAVSRSLDWSGRDGLIDWIGLDWIGLG